MQQETIRIRGKEFEKWQRESAKIERNRARNAEIDREREMKKKIVREKAHIWCEADQVKYHQQQQQQKQTLQLQMKEQHLQNYR